MTALLHHPNYRFLPKTIVALLLLLLLQYQTCQSITPTVTESNWDELTFGKTVFIRFCSKSCGHCQGMETAWKKLMTTWENSDHSFVGDVDCDNETSFCNKLNILGTPTLFFGDPDNLQQYAGDKDFLSLNKFANQILKPLCSASYTDGCNEKEKERIDEFMTWSDEKITETIHQLEDQVEQAQKVYDKEMKRLQGIYDNLNLHREIVKANHWNEIRLIKKIKKEILGKK